MTVINSNTAAPRAYGAEPKSDVQNNKGDKEVTNKPAVTNEESTLGDKATSSLNNGSDMSIDPFLKEANNIKQGKVDEVQKVIDKNKTRIQVYEEFDKLLKEFQSLSDTLLFSNNNTIKHAIVSKETTAFSIEPNGIAPTGSFDFNVEQIATNHQLKSQQLPGLKTAMGDSTIDTRTLKIELANGTSFNIELKTDQTSPLEISKAIAAANKGVTSRVIKSGEDQSYITISSTETGTESAIASITVIGDDTLNEKLKYTQAATGTPVSTTGMTESASAKDAKFTINGAPITSQKNVIEEDEVIQGVKITLFEESDEPITVTVEEDNSKFTADVVTWIKAFNQLKMLQNDATRIDVDPDKRGVLDFRNPLSDLMESISKVMDQQFGNGNITSLSDARLDKNYDKADPKDPNGTNGTFNIRDDNVELFQATVQNNMADFKQLFMGNDEHQGLANEMKQLISNEFSHRGGNGSALEESQNRLREDNSKLSKKIDSIEETSSKKINQLKDQFARMQEALTRFNDATNYFKLMTGSKD
nr:flagellar filament capping protein FliD [uncultured Moellerella sp.]